MVVKKKVSFPSFLCAREKESYIFFSSFICVKRKDIVQSKIHYFYEFFNIKPRISLPNSPYSQ